MGGVFAFSSHLPAIIDDTCVQSEREREEKERRERKRERERERELRDILMRTFVRARSRARARVHARAHKHTHTGLRDMLRTAFFGRAHPALQTHLPPVLHPQVPHSTKLL